MDLKDVITRQFEAVNRHDADAAASGYSPAATVLDPWYPEPLRGRDAIAGDFAAFFVAVPDLEVTVNELLVDGNGYAIELTMRGTHSGPLAGPEGEIPPTNNRFDIRGTVFGQFDADGQIAHERRNYDLARMMSQLGLNE